MKQAAELLGNREGNITPEGTLSPTQSSVGSWMDRRMRSYSGISGGTDNSKLDLFSASNYARNR